jgi:outer membrane usher protein
MRRYSAGDLINGGLSWSRPVHMAGVQVQSDFNMRPDLVTFPTPTLKGDATAASTLDLFVNGESRYTGPTPGGAFDLPRAPVLTGANEIAMTVTDASGRRTVQTLSFYASPTMLTPGLASYSAEAGVLREGYGGLDDRYARAAASATGRYGMSSSWTVEAHGEAAPGLTQLGAGSAFASPYGVLSLAAAASAGGRGGGYGSASFERTSSQFSISAGVEAMVGDFRDMATVSGATPPQARTRLQFSLPLGADAAFNLAYVHTVASKRAPVGGDSVIASYSHNFGQRASLTASVYETPGPRGGLSAFLTLSVTFGTRSAAVSAFGGEGAGSGVLAEAAKPALHTDDNEWRVAAQTGAQKQLLAEGGRQTGFGEFTLGVDRLAKDTAVQATAIGSLALLDGRLFASRAIDDSFAVIDAGAPGVEVLSDNHPVGRSGADGRLLAPDLRSFQSDTVALDAADVPFEFSLDADSVTVKPSDRAGVVARFHLRKIDQALLVLVDNRGQALPLGDRIADGSADGALVGYAGQALVTGLKAHNRLTVAAPNGRLCLAEFDYAPTPGSITRIGPVVCRDGSAP